MKQIKLISLTLTNFKGITNKEIVFDGKNTNISADNGVGKTTIFDAFTWVLFGKDSQDRKTFDIKTRDTRGNVIPDIPHEVKAVISVDGEMITLRRVFKEKWVKRHGDTERTFTGHEEERYYNDVPCPLKEWSDKITAICDEKVFKYITSPSYFVSQKADVQREMLFDMAGDITDTDVAADNKNFADLLATMGNKTTEEYKKELAVKKRNVSAECDSIPSRIDERARDYADVDMSQFDNLDKKIEKEQKEVERLEGLIQDENKRINDNNAKEIEHTHKVAELKNKLAKAESRVESEVTREYYQQQSEYKSKVAQRDSDIEVEKSMLKRYNDAINIAVSRKTQLEEVVSKRQAMRTTFLAKRDEILHRELVFTDDDFKCPTCGRTLEVKDIEKKKAEMVEKFNTKKAADLAENTKEGVENTNYIKNTLSQIAGYDEDITNLSDKKAECEKHIADLQAQVIDKPTSEKPDATDAINKDSEVIALRQQIADEDNVVFTIDNDAAVPTYKTEKAEHENEIVHLRGLAATKDAIINNEKRIAELREQLAKVSQEKANIERIESTIAEFEKAKVLMIESNINKMFGHVTFKMYEQQINGGSKAICEAAYEGRPFSTCSNAEKINIGLDIINAICAYRQICAPIFIDNAESINRPLDTTSQQVRLIVTTEKELTITQN